MHVLLLIGKRKSRAGEKGPFQFECLYIGQDGVALQEAAEEAASEEVYIELGRLVNPTTAPMPIDPTPVVRSKPSFPRSEKKVVQLPARPLSALEKKSAELLEERRKKAQVVSFNDNKGRMTPPDMSTKVDEKGLRLDGPTFEEWLVMGHKPAGYPPNGHAAKPSEAWELWKKEEEAKKKASTSSATPPETAAPSTTENVPPASAPAQESDAKDGAAKTENPT